jgi:hypothetical protein
VSASPAWDATPPFCFARDGGGRRTEPSNSAIDDAVKHQVAGSSPAGGAKINTLEPSALWPRLESATFMLSSCSRREATRPAKVTFCSTTVFLSTSWIRPRYSEKRPYSSILSSYIEKVRTKKGPSDIVNRDLAKDTNHYPGGHRRRNPAEHKFLPVSTVFPSCDSRISGLPRTPGSSYCRPPSVASGCTNDSSDVSRI